jgi:hypothetical protein
MSSSVWRFLLLSPRRITRTEGDLLYHGFCFLYLLASESGPKDTEGLEEKATCRLHKSLPQKTGAGGCLTNGLILQSYTSYCFSHSVIG